jgi:hypothetical protein
MLHGTRDLNPGIDGKSGIYGMLKGDDCFEKDGVVKGALRDQGAKEGLRIVQVIPRSEEVDVVAEESGQDNVVESCSGDRGDQSFCFENIISLFLPLSIPILKDLRLY